MVRFELIAVAAATAIFASVGSASAEGIKTLVLGDYSLEADVAILADLTGSDARFNHDTSSAYDLSAGLPTNAFLAGYDSILVFTDHRSVKLSALSNLLGTFVRHGGGVVIGTFWGQQAGSSGGLLNRTGYNPLIHPSDNPYDAQVLGTFDASDPLMANVSSLASEHFSGDYEAGLDTGATLVASWASGRPLTAYNAAHTVVAITLTPNVITLGQTTGDYRPLFANALVFTANAAIATIPEPAAWSLMVIGFGTIGMAVRRRTVSLAA